MLNLHLSEWTITETYDIQVKSLAVTPDAEKLIGMAGRLCSDTQDKTGTVPDWIQMWMEIGHESVVEHVYGTFCIHTSCKIGKKDISDSSR